MTFAVLTVNTTLSATKEDLYTDPGGTHSFSFTSGTKEQLFILDDDATFDDIDIGDANQIVAPASTIFLDNTPISSRHKFMVTPDNGDPAFTVYVLFENSTTNDDFNAINTLNYALVSETLLISGVIYSISNHKNNAAVAYSNFPNVQLCFGTGTRIRAAGGDVPIEVLRPGDRVWTLDNGLLPVLWISHTTHR